MSLIEYLNWNVWNSLVVLFGLLIITALAFVVICSLLETQTMSTSRHGNRKHLPIPQGPYSVGCLDIMTKHSSNGCFMRLYYPTEDNVMHRSMQWPTWIPGKAYIDGYAHFLRMWPPIFKTVLKFLIGDVYIPAIWNALPLQGMKFPIIIFSHGLGGCRTAYSVICTELASRGFLVAAVEHRDQSASLTFYMREMNPSLQPDTMSESLSSSLENIVGNNITEYIQLKHAPLDDYEFRNNQVKQRSQECIKALDTLTAINKGEFVNNVLDPNYSAASFQNIMDVSRVAGVGHSFGGSSILLSLAKDQRFSVAVVLDAWMFPIKDESSCYENKRQPILFINTESFNTVQNKNRMSRMESDAVERKMLTIRGTVHQNQSDLPFICGSLTRRLFKASSTLNHHTAMDINNQLTMQFLWKYLDVPVNERVEKYLEENKSHVMDGVYVKSQL